MARTNDGETQVIPDGETATPEGEAGEAAKQAKPRTTITVATNVPVEMKELLDKLAEQNGKTTAVFVREQLAGLVKYELPAAIRKGRATGKYDGMTEEDKKAAIAKEQSEKRQKASALLAALEAGDLDVDLAAILAKYKPAERAPRKVAEGEVTNATETASEPAAEPANA